MDQQRHQVYVGMIKQLLEQLLSCASGEEKVAVLQRYADLGENQPRSQLLV